MRTMRCATVLMAAAVLAAQAGVARAESGADRVPSDAVVYFQWAGSDALGDAFEHSHFKALTDTLNLRQLIAQQIATQGAAADAVRAQQKKVWMEWTAAARKAPTVGYMGPFDFSTGDKPAPKIAVFSKVGSAEATTLAKEMMEVHAEKKDTDVPFSATVVNDYLVLTVGTGLDIAQRLSAAAVPADSLGSTDGFKAAMAQVGNGAGDAAAVIYVNGEAGLRVIDEGIEAKARPDQQRLWSQMEGALGISELKQMAVAGRFDGADWAMKGFIGLGEKRVGLVGFLDSPALSKDTYALIPADATWANVIRFDGMRFLEDMRNATAEMGATTQRRFDYGLQQFFAWTGVDLKNDLLASEGDEYAFYGVPAGPGADAKAARNFTMAAKLKNGPKLETALGTLEGVIGAMAGQRDPNTKIVFKTEPLAAPSDKITAHMLALDTITPTWAIANGVLYFSMQKEGVQRAVDRATQAKGGTILDNAAFADLQKKLGQAGEGASSFSFVDLPKMAPEIYELLGGLLKEAKAKKGGEAIAYTLPPLEKLMPDLGPSLRESWTDKDGWHFKSVGPLPLTDIVGPEGVIFNGLVKHEVEAEKKAAGTEPAKEALP